ncbi:hypothetical protein CVT25_000198 [Psilocybe cyanescens]|uniref:Uncharacterized protein n=1 Tax=Psilocybe cyanescens TaxID=93625 RepID=A0A409XQJ0_PSICY|nr:hypothetical protein CVT25_000198 [Psilocybe cyanescens]
MSNIPVIAFGSSPDVYYIGLGMRYYMAGMPESVRPTIQKLPAIQLQWMSIEEDGSWATREGYGCRTEFSTSVTQGAIDKIKAFPAADYVTFGPTKSIFCAITPGQGWAGSMADEQIEKLREMQASVGGEDVFNQGLKGILFGKGMTMIFMFKGGFSYYTDSEAEGGKMESLLNEYIYRQPAWTLERGSTLCPWNVDYYFLKFKDPESSTIKMFWSLPQSMADNLADLQATLATPEAQQAIANHEQLGLVLATSNYVQYTNGWPVYFTQNLSIAAANALRVSTGAYVYRW